MVDPRPYPKSVDICTTVNYVLRTSVKGPSQPKEAKPRTTTSTAPWPKPTLSRLSPVPGFRSFPCRNRVDSSHLYYILCPDTWLAMQPHIDCAPKKPTTTQHYALQKKTIIRVISRHQRTDGMLEYWYGTLQKNSKLPSLLAKGRPHQC